MRFKRSFQGLFVHLNVQKSILRSSPPTNYTYLFWLYVLFKHWTHAVISSMNNEYHNMYGIDLCAHWLYTRLANVWAQIHTCTHVQQAIDAFFADEAELEATSHYTQLSIHLKPVMKPRLSAFCNLRALVLPSPHHWSTILCHHLLFPAFSSHSHFFCLCVRLVPFHITYHMQYVIHIISI